MAKPSNKDGFLLAGYEWLASILAAGFNGLEQVVCLEVALQVRGMGRRAAATLSPGDIARRLGKEPPNVSRAIRSLVAQGVLEKLDGPTYRPVEDYERWDLGEKPEARAARVAYCRDAPRLAKSYRQSDPRPGDRAQQQLPFRDDESPPPTPVEMVADHDQIRSSPMIKSDNDHDQIRSSPMIKSDNETEAPIEERARGIENLRETLRLFPSPSLIGIAPGEGEIFPPDEEGSEDDLAARWRAMRGRVIDVQ